MESISRAYRRASKIGIFLLVHFATGIASAHDIWLAPEQSVMQKGDTLTVHQWVGAELEQGTMDGEGTKELPLIRRITQRFELITAAGSVDLLSELPDEKTRPVVKPVLQRRIDSDGLVLVAMEHAFIYDEHAREQFLEYLEHEGYPLEHREHRHEGQRHDGQRHEKHAVHEHGVEDFLSQLASRPTQRERYRRFLKTLIQVGQPEQGPLHRRQLGQELEILLLQNPYQLDTGSTLEVKVLFQGEPLSGRQVKAYNRDENGRVAKSSARTGTDGIARFRLDRNGFWLFRLVHLRPCDSRADATGCEFADWESDWASYSFELQ